MLCAMFGHQPVKDFQWGRRPVTGSYPSRIVGPVVDGIGRNHFQVFVECPRCGAEYMGARVHGEDIAARLEPRP